ncbi:Dyp-type peroxidase [Microbacterium hydrocarbonoxydans]|uniref:Dyp-type peroxidase n=1 Tax=Microbacterium hydrocarbonoxydans TaxID=273678 RepID=UPI00203B0187|nr:Dyp-type peroxidase [Microbacterium hydrocarbonoxydans]MCM3778754.1 Dyp-type peroxidase [Microbacterium hydrocarbonoxydans]
MKHDHQGDGVDQGRRGMSRRTLLGSGGVALGLALAAPGAASGSGLADGVRASGERQAGVARPRVPQPHLLLAVFEIVGDPSPLLAALGSRILDAAAGDHPALGGLDPGDLTVTVGVGPRLVAMNHPGSIGSEALPPFPREEIDDLHRDGDLVLQICATDPLLPALVLALLTGSQPQLRERWRQRGMRGGAVPVRRGHAAARNLLGFVDGVAVPTSPEELDDSVWIDDGPAAGGTLMVVRRIEIDVARFGALSVPAQEAVIGRRRASGAPLSGGGRAADVDLQAKTADGRYRIPVDAHVRRAHPRPAGVPLMLRRSYSMDDPLGLLFISMQRELSTFSRTLERMSESDALLSFTRTTASGSFLVLPGFDKARSLGSTLFGSGRR